MTVESERHGVPGQLIAGWTAAALATSDMGAVMSLPAPTAVREAEHDHISAHP